MKQIGVVLAMGLGVLLPRPAPAGAQWLESNKTGLTSVNCLTARGPDTFLGAVFWDRSVSVSQDKAEDARACITSGDRAYRAGDYANAIVFFSKAIELDPKSSYARFWRAWAYLNTGGRSSYDRALADVTRFIELDPADKSIYFARGEIFYNLAGFALDKRNQPEVDGLLAKALADYQTALNANPDSTVILRSIGQAYFAKGDLDRALGAYSKVLQKNPDDREIESDLKRLFGAYDRRQREVDAGDFKDTWYLAGDFYAGTHRDVQAAKCFSKAIELGRADALVYLSRARAYIRTGQFVEALSDANRVIKLSGDYYDYGLRAEVNKAKGDLDQALADYAKAIRLASKKTSDYLEAEIRAHATIDFLSARAEIFAEKKAWDKAIKEYRAAGKILTAGSGKARIFSRIGQFYEEKGDAANAQKYRQQAEAMEPQLKKR
jgi:tetratricopeptide (TPR) repeat protein